jgi:hypothetical protein
MQGSRVQAQPGDQFNPWGFFGQVYTPCMHEDNAHTWQQQLKSHSVCWHWFWQELQQLLAYCAGHSTACDFQTTSCLREWILLHARADSYSTA